MNLMRHQSTFRGMLNQLDDQVVVRMLLDHMVPEDTKADILACFNSHVENYNKRVVEEQSHGKFTVETSATVAECEIGED